jgi:hypothetical protein
MMWLMWSRCACFLLLFSAPILRAQMPVTFSKDVAPILFGHCAVCHHPNDIAPMSLLTYKEARPWAAAIRQAVVTRKMPPWHADPHVGQYLNDARLSDAQISKIVKWVETGAPEGDPKDLPPAPVFENGWHIKPDLVLSIPETHVAAGDQDDYEYIYVPTDFTEDKWIQVAEVVPGDRRVVHHATVSVVSPDKVPGLLETHNGSGANAEDKNKFRTGKVEHIRPEMPILDDGCASPDGGGFPGKSSGSYNRVPGIYLPGHLAETRPPGYALKIPAGSYLQFQVHYSNRLNETVSDKTSIGLIFAKQPVEHEVAQYEIWNNLFQIPPNTGNHKVRSCYTLEKEVMAVAYTAHMHFRGKSMQTEAFYPDGRHEVIFSVPKYDFRWQETYFLKNQFILPKGTRLITTAYFDNSPNNPLNPDPSKAVRWGEPSDEEMMGFWLAFSDVSPLKDSARKPEATR